MPETIMPETAKPARGRKRAFAGAVLTILVCIAASGCGGSDESVSDTGLFPAGDVEPGEIATYEVTFNAEWSAESHPQDFPMDPHFSGLIGATHDGSILLWMEGEIATPGIKKMAETGSKDPLSSEIDSEINGGRAYFKLSGDGVDASPGVTSLVFDVSEKYPLVSLVSMIAPSPDWFVGVDSLNLKEGGEWVDSVTVELYPYDAGTDEGASFESTDMAADPFRPVSKIAGPPFLSNGEIKPLGTFTFTKIDDEGETDDT